MSQQQPPSAPPPGWYPDQPGWERRWDGARWTDERRQVPQAPVQQHNVQRPVPAPGAVPSPHDVPTVKPGEWPAQPAQPAQPVPPAPPTQVPPRQPVWPGAAPSGPPAFAPPTQSAGQFGPPPSGPPVGPPGYGAPSGYGAPPVGPPAYGVPPVGQPAYAPPRKKSLAWLWVTLALVLVVAVGSAAALVVLRPWEDDTTSASDDSGDASEEAEDGEAPAPSEPDADDSPSTAPPPDIVTGDIDGDGLGDAVAVFRDRSEDPTVRFTFTSTGTGFDTEREELDTFEDRVWLDVDQDGAADGLTWVYETDDTLTITSDVTDEQQFTVRLIDDAPYINLETGDFDGDGATDLLASGETKRHQVTAWVLRNNGNGFDEPEEWMVQDGATFFDVSFYPGDFTGDGLTDVAARVPTGSFPQEKDYYNGKYGVALLESTGSAFDARPADQLDDDYLTTAAVGDFAGDGTPRLAVFDTSGAAVEVEVYEWGGSAFEPAFGWQGRLSTGDEGYVTAELVSDVDGNGFDDLVYTYKSTKDNQLDGIRVALSDGSAFGAGELWADLPRCKDQYCFTYFQGG